MTRARRTFDNARVRVDHWRVLRALPATLALVVLASGCGETVHSTADDDPVITRPLTIHQGSLSQRLHPGLCRSAAVEARTCWRLRYPRQALTGVHPNRPFRLTFSSTARVEMYLWRVRHNNSRRVGDWDGTVQCIDSACASSVGFPDRRLASTGIPHQANTLRVVIYGRGTATGVDIPLAADERN